MGVPIKQNKIDNAMSLRYVQYARRHRVLWVLTHLGQKRQISVKQKPNDSAISLAIESSDSYSTESDLLLVHV